jgi:ribonucleoside-diphosphate reductase alpha chain
MSRVYSKEEVEASALEYFDGDSLAANVWVTKYALRNEAGEYVEKNPDDMHRRLASEFARVEAIFGGDKALTEEQVYHYVKDFKYIVPQGSPMYGIGNVYQTVSLSNCVVVDSPEDNMSSIVDTGRSLANLFKRRCGVGLDLSNLRPEFMKVSNAAGTTSGAWSFADFYSYVCRMVGQNGRRGALMISMDVKHPDAFNFTKMKMDNRLVTGANVSLKIRDDFMQALESGQKYTLQWPVDSENPKVTTEIDPVELWDLIIKCATDSAEPGLLMWDNILNALPANCYEMFKTVSTNPCGEIPLSPNDSCRLISINLKSFVSDPFTESATFDFEKFKEVVHVAMRLMDDLVTLEEEKLRAIIDRCDTEDEKVLWNKLLSACVNGRRTGLGTHGLADALACLGLKYDGDNGLAQTEEIYKTLRDVAYATSVELAKERGAFPVFDWEKEKDNIYINRLPADLLQEMSVHGRRNISILTNAPTGSVSIVSQTSSGLEPVFRNFYIRRRKLSHNEQHLPADFVDELGDRWQEYKVYHHNVKQYVDRHGDALPEFFVESDQINWERRVDIQGVIQYYIDHSISSTINLPAGTSYETVSTLYKRAWKKGLKGVTIYVDGCRTGVLVTETSNKKGPQGYFQALVEAGCVTEDAETTEDQVIRKNVKLPDTFKNGDTHIVKREGSKYYLNFSYLQNFEKHPIAFFVHSNSVQNGEYVTLNRGCRTIQKLLIEKGVDTDLVLDQVEKIRDNPHHTRLGKMVSMALRHNIRIVDIVEALTGIEGDYISSTLTAIRKFLSYQIEDGTKATGKKCEACGSDNIVYESGCDICRDCGSSGCS